MDTIWGVTYSWVQATEVDVSSRPAAFRKTDGWRWFFHKRKLYEVPGLGDLEAIEERFHVRICFKLSINVAGPNLNDVVTVVLQELYLFHSSLVKFVHGKVIDWVDRISGIALWTSVPYAALDFPNCVRFAVETIHQILVNTLLAMVMTSMTNGNVVPKSYVHKHL